MSKDKKLWTITAMLKTSELMNRRLTTVCRPEPVVGISIWIIPVVTALKNVAIVDMFRTFSLVYSCADRTAGKPTSTKSFIARPKAWMSGPSTVQRSCK